MGVVYSFNEIIQKVINMECVFASVIYMPNMSAEQIVRICGKCGCELKPISKSELARLKTNLCHKCVLTLPRTNKAEPTFCKQCNKQLAQSPSKRGESGLCRKCAQSQPRSEEFKLNISKKLSGRIRSPAHCMAISKAARERYTNPENHPRWKGGNKTYNRNKSRDIMGIVDPALHVHHIDGNWRNNDPSNLLVLTSGEHTTLHNLLGRASMANKIAQEWFRIRRAILFVFGE
jgi:hypothetical protein